ncbi:MAG: asparaginase [Alphaproteobacteria bacterium]|nr:asparaginase [Alphaproteobacteria bacterium]
MSNPTLIEVTRGPLVESFHTGSLAIVSATSGLVLALGDIRRPVYPRSAIKALQALPLIESGAADHYRYGDAEIALACASHTGTSRHTKIADGMLKAAELSESDLGCGAHTPLGAKAAKDLWRSGAEPSQLHNNCSGKHAGMLATARHLGIPVDGYWRADHPMQQRVLEILNEISGLELGSGQMGFDGCSLPNWAMPLETMAAMFAKLVSGHGIDAQHAKAFGRLMQACWAEPEMVAGPGRADSVVMANLPGRVFMKTGAEGVYCGGFPELGVGFALKIDDGATRASAGTAMTLVEHVFPEARGLMRRNILRSWRGLEVGEIRTGPVLTNALSGLRLR